MNIITPVRPMLRLGQDQIDDADNIGRMRQENAITEGRRDVTGLCADEETSLYLNIDGIRGEAAAFDYLGPCHWYRFKTGRLSDTPDLAAGRLLIDVKWIGKPHHKLIVRPTGHRKWAYFLVDGSAHPWYRMCGWCWGYEAMDNLPLEDPTRTKRPPAHFVPQDHPIMKKPEELVELMESEREDAYWD